MSLDLAAPVVPESGPTEPAGSTGRARALTVISPLPRRWAWVLRAILLYKRLQGPDPELQRLSVIHAAQWVVLSRFPGQGRRSRYAYLLFVSNFDGSWRDYIDAFATLIPPRMNLLWGTSYGFPGAQPPRPFARYIERNQQPPGHFYSAYPEASPTEVASALRVRHLLDRYRPQAGATPDEYERAWGAFVEAAQRDL